MNDPITALIALILVIVLAIVWLIFPFVVMSRLRWLAMEIRQANKHLAEISNFTKMTGAYTINVDHNTRKLSEFFDGRRVEVNQQQQPSA